MRLRTIKYKEMRLENDLSSSVPNSLFLTFSVFRFWTDLGKPAENGDKPKPRVSTQCLGNFFFIIPLISISSS